jgi:lysine-N-methylase
LRRTVTNNAEVKGHATGVTGKLFTLPILEQWDCHHCTACCRETTIPLSSADVARLHEQGWDRRPEFQGVATVRRAGLGRGDVLAHRADGSCVFLTDAGRCRIHEEFGAEAKPRACQLFPLQVVATDRGGAVTVRRSCPSAAADKGRPLEQHLPTLRRLLTKRFADLSPPPAPPILRGVARGWDAFHGVSDALGRLLTDERWPMVRRVVHGLRFCALVEECKWKRVEAPAIGELTELLEQSASADVGELFQDRRPPGKSAAKLFRRLGAHFLRCVPGGPPTRTWRDQLNSLRLSGQLARARKALPAVPPLFSAVSLEQLERPLGPLPPDVLRPLQRFFESHALSLQYALVDPRLPLVASFRRLAFTFPTALWMLRWLAAERTPKSDDVVTIVVALERGYVMPALNAAARHLARSGELERMVAWYAR